MPTAAVQRRKADRKRLHASGQLVLFLGGSAHTGSSAKVLNEVSLATPCGRLPDI